MDFSREESTEDFVIGENETVEQAIARLQAKFEDIRPCFGCGELTDLKMIQTPVKVKDIGFITLYAICQKCFDNPKTIPMLEADGRIRFAEQ